MRVHKGYRPLRCQRPTNLRTPLRHEVGIPFRVQLPLPLQPVTQRPLLKVPCEIKCRAKLLFPPKSAVQN